MRYNGDLPSSFVNKSVCAATIRSAALWVQSSLEQRQRFQQLFFPDGIPFDGKGFVRTGVTPPAFSCLRDMETGNEGLVGPEQRELEPDRPVAGAAQRPAACRMIF